MVDSGVLYFLLFAMIPFLFIKIKKYIRMIIVASKIPGPGFIEVIRTSFKVFAEPHEIYKHIIAFQDRLKDINKLWMGPKLFIFLYNPEDIEIILSSNDHIDKSQEYTFFKPWFGEGLLISTSVKWKHDRKMIAPTFHQSILKSFLPKFYENSLKVCEKMQQENGKNFDAHDYMSGVTVDILLDTAMGYNVRRSEKRSHKYAMAVMKLCDILHKRHYKWWLRPDFIFKKSSLYQKHEEYLQEIKALTNEVVLHKKIQVLNTGVEQFNKSSEIVDQSIEEVISGYNYGTAVRDDLDANDEDIGERKCLPFLDQLTLNAQSEDSCFTEEEVHDQVNTFMFEGHDTTAAGSSFTLCLMGIHKDIQEKVIQEVDEIFQGTDRECTFADTLEMKYLERVIMETLRMYPPVPIISRELQEEVKMASGDYSLPAGATVSIIQAMLHRRPDVFPNPDTFNPDNFLPEKCQDRHFYSYIPFSAGPRSCVGRKFAMLKLKVLLSTFFRRYRVHCDMKERDFKLQADIILKLNGGFQIHVEERK